MCYCACQWHNTFNKICDYICKILKIKFELNFLFIKITQTLKYRIKQWKCYIIRENNENVLSKDLNYQGQKIYYFPLG